MGWLKLAGSHRHSDSPDVARRTHRTHAVLSEIYGGPVPTTARVLERHLRRGRIPLRDPEHPDNVVTVNLPLAADSCGCDLEAVHRYLHDLHAAGRLAVDEHGIVELLNQTDDNL